MNEEFPRGTNALNVPHGMTTSAGFQRRVEKEFERVATVRLPNWPFARDDLDGVAAAVGAGIVGGDSICISLTNRIETRDVRTALTVLVRKCHRMQPASAREGLTHAGRYTTVLADLGPPSPCKGKAPTIVLVDAMLLRGRLLCRRQQQPFVALTTVLADSQLPPREVTTMQKLMQHLL